MQSLSSEEMKAKLSSPVASPTTSPMTSPMTNPAAAPKYVPPGRQHANEMARLGIDRAKSPSGESVLSWESGCTEHDEFTSPPSRSRDKSKLRPKAIEAAPSSTSHSRKVSSGSSHNSMSAQPATGPTAPHATSVNRAPRKDTHTRPALAPVGSATRIRALLSSNQTMIESNANLESRHSDLESRHAELVARHANIVNGLGEVGHAIGVLQRDQSTHHQALEIIINNQQAHGAQITALQHAVAALAFTAGQATQPQTPSSGRYATPTHITAHNNLYVLVDPTSGMSAVPLTPQRVQLTAPTGHAPVNPFSNQHTTPSTGGGARIPQGTPQLSPNPADDVFGNNTPPTGTSTKAVFPLRTFNELFTDFFGRSFNWVHVYCIKPMIVTKVGNQDIARLLDLCRTHIDNAQMARELLQDLKVRDYVLAGVLNRLLTDYIFDACLFDEFPNQYAQTYAQLWEQSTRVQDSLEASNDTTMRLGLHKELAGVANAIIATPGFWSWKDQHVFHLTGSLAQVFQELIPSTHTDGALHDLSKIIDMAMRLNARARREDRYLAVKNHRLGSRWLWKEMVQRNPELTGQLVNMEPAEHVVRCTIAPEVFFKIFAERMVTYEKVHKAEVLLCSRRKYLR